MTDKEKAGREALQKVDELEGQLSQDQKNAIIDYANGVNKSPSGIDLDSLDIDLTPIKIQING